MALVLVTGGCGFIGSHLCEALAAGGHHMRVLDDLSTGSLANLVPGAELIRGSIVDPEIVAHAMENVDACFHLAAIASVQRGTEAWLATHQVNLGGAINVFEAARKAAIPVIYASSAAVYGLPEHSPLDEGSRLRPLSAYGADKLGCELHARVAGAVHGVPTFGLRFFNVYGPRQDPRSPYSGVISIFCERLARGEAVVLHGDGGQTRDFVHVSDVVAALLAAWPRADIAAPVSNVCTGRATSVRALAEAIGRLLDRPVGVQEGPVRAGDIRESLGSPERMRDLLGLDARTDLDKGLAGILAWLSAGSPGVDGAVSPQPNASLAARITASHKARQSAVTEANDRRLDQRWS